MILYQQRGKNEKIRPLLLSGLILELISLGIAAFVLADRISVGYAGGGFIFIGLILTLIFVGVGLAFVNISDENFARKKPYIIAVIIIILFISIGYMITQWLFSPGEIFVIAIVGLVQIFLTIFLMVDLISFNEKKYDKQNK